MKFPLFLHGEVATWEIVIWEMYIWKVASWEIAAWKKAFGKVPNIHIMYRNQFLKMMILLFLNESLQ